MIENDGRPVGTRTPDLYRVKAPLLCTSNNFEGVEDRLGTCKHGQAGVLTGEITGEEFCSWPKRAKVALQGSLLLMDLPVEL